MHKYLSEGLRMNSREFTQADRTVMAVFGLLGALIFLPGIVFGLIIYSAAYKLECLCCS